MISVRDGRRQGQMLMLAGGCERTRLEGHGRPAFAFKRAPLFELFDLRGRSYSQPKRVPPHLEFL